MFLFSQLCGLIVSVAAITSMQLKNIKWILVCQLICNGIGALSYILLGGLSGCGIYLVALAQSIIYYFFRVRNKKAPIVLSIAFLCAYLICSATTFKSSIDFISALAALSCALSIMQEKPSLYRVFMLLNGAIWMIYDMGVGAYTMIISHIATTLSAAVGIIRLDIKKDVKS